MTPDRSSLEVHPLLIDPRESALEAAPEAAPEVVPAVHLLLEEMLLLPSKSLDYSSFQEIRWRKRPLDIPEERMHNMRITEETGMGDITETETIQNIVIRETEKAADPINTNMKPILRSL